MKKSIIICLVVVGILLLDTIQAFVLNNSPLIKLREYFDDGTLNYVDRGVLVDTYCGLNGIKDTVIKGFSYSLSYSDNYEIVDTSKGIKDFSCDTALEKIYQDDNYIYYLNCIKSEYIEVRYENARKENIIEALEMGHISINDLDKFNIEYIKVER